MTEPDLNLLIALDALLAEASVAGAARRLGLSASAMSRTLSRLRAVTGDPLLVRAGRRLVPTPYAEEIRPRTRQVLDKAHAILRPPAAELQRRRWRGPSFCVLTRGLLRHWVRSLSQPPWLPLRRCGCALRPNRIKPPVCCAKGVSILRSAS